MKTENLPQAQEKQLVTLPNKEEIVSYFRGASTLQLSPEENQRLSASFDENLIEIRPDGYIYLPQTFYRQRLNEVVGIGQWALIPKGSYQEGNKMMLNGILVIRGCFMSESTGEANINDQQSLATVWEGAKSDCITRCCKDLSIASELYEPAFIQSWQKKHAMAVKVMDRNNKPVKRWRKKEADPLVGEVGIWEFGFRFKNDSPQSSASTGQTAGAGQQAPKKEWLNPLIKGTTEDNPEWIKVSNNYVAGLVTMKEIEESYLISRNNKELLELAKNNGRLSISSPMAGGELPWLNPRINNLPCPDWDQAAKDISLGKISVDGLKKKYRISRENIKALHEFLADPLKIWKFCLGGCTTKEQVEKLANECKDHFAEVHGLRELFVAKHKELSQNSVTA